MKLIKGERVKNVTELYLLIFGDLKKHTFKYQFLSTATAVKNYKVVSWEPATSFYSTP